MVSYYAVEVKYIGTNYSGSQYQKNTLNTIQGQLEIAFNQILITEKPIQLTGSSRTDKGVHARQNFFHFQYPSELEKVIIKQLNCVLPQDIAVVNVYNVQENFHSRYLAEYREYQYYIHWQKDPFKTNQTYFYFKPIQRSVLEQAASIIKRQNNFEAFCKKHTQNATTFCEITESNWKFDEYCCMYTIRGNRFLRGMVKALVSTMLMVNKNVLSLEDFENIFKYKSNYQQVVFNVPSCGLVLNKVFYPKNIVLQPLK